LIYFGLNPRVTYSTHEKIGLKLVDNLGAYLSTTSSLKLIDGNELLIFIAFSVLKYEHNNVTYYNFLRQ
jgi:hypothetical protein